MTHQDTDVAPPHDLEAEQGALGSMLLAKEAFGVVDGIINPCDHYRPAHQLIHEAAREVNSRNEPVDGITVAEQLTRSGQITKAGGRTYLHTLLASVPTAAHAEYYAQIVRRKAMRRRLIEAGTRTVQLGYALDVDDDEILERAARELDKAAAFQSVFRLQTSAELLQETVDDLTNAVDPGMTTGWADVDDVFRIHTSQFTVIGARTAVGKSILALNLAEHIGTDLGESCVYFSLEMKAGELMRRRIAARARIPLDRLMDHTMTDDPGGDWDRLRDAYADLAGSRLVIDENPLVGLTQIKDRIRELVRRGSKPKVVVVDLMTLLQEPAGSENRRIAVDGLSRGLKLIAREFDVAVIAVVQVNRGPEQRSDKRPLLSDLRESGGIEADADNVLLLHREDYYEKEHARAGEMDVFIAKHRNGPTCTVTLAFQPHYARLKNMAPA
jgi:replicative DNA helicase